MISFSLKQLAYFVAAAERGSTIRAAEVLNVSQPSISTAIGQLEASFAQKLFVRIHGQGLEMTPFGRRKLAEARHLLAEAEKIAAGGGLEPLQGELDVGCFETFAPTYLPAILRVFKKAHPEVAVRIREADLDALHREVDSGVLEVALLYDMGLGGRVDFRTVASIMPYALLPHRHPLARQPAVALRDLAREPLILMGLPHSRDYLLSLFRLVGAQPRVAYQAGSIEMVRGMVANGHGVAVLVTRPLNSVSADGRRVACRPLLDEVPAERIAIAMPSRFSPTPAARAFVQCAEAYFRSLA